MAHISHLAAAEDGAIDFWAAADVDHRVGHTRQVVFDEFLRVAAPAAIHVAHGEVAQEQVEAVVVVVANDASADGDCGHAVVDGIVHGFVHERGEFARHAHASECHHAATVDVAQNGAVGHADVDVALHAARAEVGFVTLAAAIHMSVKARKARCADDGFLSDRHFGMAQHMAVFRTAEDATPDAVVDVILRIDVHRDRGVVHVGESLKNIGCIALTAAEHVAVGAVQADGDVVCMSVKSTLYWCRSHLSARDAHGGQARVGHRLKVLDGGFVIFIGDGMLSHRSRFAAAIHVVEYLSAADVDGGVALHAGCFAISGIACAAAKHLAARSVDDAVVRLRMIGVLFPSIFNRAHRAAFHVDFAVMFHLSQLAAAVHVAWHKGAFVKVDLRIPCCGEFFEVEQRVCRVNDTTGRAIHAAAVPATC